MCGVVLRQWVNPFARDAYFRKVDFAKSKITFVRHPTPDMQRPINKRVSKAVPVGSDVVLPVKACELLDQALMHAPVCSARRKRSTTSGWSSRRG